jgi:hypothetical protein
VRILHHQQAPGEFFFQASGSGVMPVVATDLFLCEEHQRH